MCAKQSITKTILKLVVPKKCQTYGAQLIGFNPAKRRKFKIIKKNNDSISGFKLKADLCNEWIVFLNQSTWEVYCAAVRTEEVPQTPCTARIKGVNRTDQLRQKKLTPGQLLKT